jgi:two-component system, sensor histidine kinase RegB
VHARTGACPRVAAEETTIQALVSLLNNAADACPEAVELFCDWDEARVTLEVRDRGSGISVAARQRAGREPYSDKPGRGLGLGLLLARAAIERLGGTLEFADRPEGGAATRVSLPIGVAA